MNTRSILVGGGAFLALLAFGPTVLSQVNRVPQVGDAFVRDALVPTQTLTVNADGAAYMALRAITTGGATPFQRVSTADTNAAVIKDSAGQICSVVASNVNAAVRYLKLYNTATAPTVGTTVPLHTLAIPGATTGGVSATVQPAVCIAFSTGISMALTTEATVAGTTGVAASELVVNVTYK